MLAHVSLVLSQITRLTDIRTYRQLSRGYTALQRGKLKTKRSLSLYFSKLRCCLSRNYLQESLALFYGFTIGLDYWIWLFSERQRVRYRFSSVFASVCPRKNWKIHM